MNKDDQRIIVHAFVVATCYIMLLQGLDIIPHILPFAPMSCVGLKSGETVCSGGGWLIPLLRELFGGNVQ